MIYPVIIVSPKKNGRAGWKSIDNMRNFLFVIKWVFQTLEVVNVAMFPVKDYEQCDVTFWDGWKTGWHTGADDNVWRQGMCSHCFWKIVDVWWVWVGWDGVFIGRDKRSVFQKETCWRGVIIWMWLFHDLWEQRCSENIWTNVGEWRLKGGYGGGGGWCERMRGRRQVVLHYIFCDTFYHSLMFLCNCHFLALFLYMRRHFTILKASVKVCYECEVCVYAVNGEWISQLINSGYMR